jgi:hypothetical protein
MGYTFISYSRRQLFFAESLALHLGNQGVDIWFDLQQLEAGADWSIQLKEGIENAERMVLVVSQASLESHYTRAEWETHLNQGKSLILAIFEPVDLPEILEGLPTLDFCAKFDEKITQLARFLQGDGSFLNEPVCPKNKLNIPSRFPSDISLVLLAFWTPFLSLLVATLNLVIQIGWVDFFKPPEIKFTFLIVAGVAVIGIFQFLKHKLDHVGLKRWMIGSLALQAVIGLFAYLLKTDIDNQTVPLTINGWLFLMLPLLLLSGMTFYVYVFTLRRSPEVLRWFGSGQADQKHRRRIHQPLVESANLALVLDRISAIAPIKYALHNDSADKPLARRIKRAFTRVGHTLVKDPVQASHHVAIITSRSSQAWVQNITATYRHKLVFVIGSTIDFKKSLSETGQYQWIDFRSGDKKVIEIMARSIENPENWKRESALEATPTRISELLLPSGMVILKGISQFLGAYLVGISIHPLTIYNGMTAKELVREFRRVGMLFPLELTADHRQAVVSILIGFVFLWLTSRTMLERRVPKQLVYTLLFAGIYYTLTILFSGPSSNPYSIATNLLAVPSLFIAAAYSLPDGYHWLPGLSRKRSDEVGIEQGNLDKARRQNMLWSLLLTALFIYLGSMVEIGHM